jgi:hypothetical protein
VAPLVLVCDTHIGRARPAPHTLVSLHDDHAPVRTRLDWEARVLIRGALQHMAQRPGVV